MLRFHMGYMVLSRSSKGIAKVYGEFALLPGLGGVIVWVVLVQRVSEHLHLQQPLTVGAHLVNGNLWHLQRADFLQEHPFLRPPPAVFGLPAGSLPTLKAPHVKPRYDVVPFPEQALT